jgi:hypothetical protein
MERVGIRKSPWQKQINGTFLTQFNSLQLPKKEETLLCRLSTLFPRLVNSYFIHSLMYELNGLAITEISGHKGRIGDLVKWNATNIVTACVVR